MNIKEIVERMKHASQSPNVLSDLRVELAGEYAYKNGELAELLMRKPAKWNELRKEQKSDTSTERVYQATKDGMRETELRIELKTIEKLLSATKTQIDLLKGEELNG